VRRVVGWSRLVTKSPNDRLERLGRTVEIERLKSTDACGYGTAAMFPEPERPQRTIRPRGTIDALLAVLGLLISGRKLCISYEDPFKGINFFRLLGGDCGERLGAVAIPVGHEHGYPGSNGSFAGFLKTANLRRPVISGKVHETVERGACKPGHVTP
jgi:hypothetical protein